MTNSTAQTITALALLLKGVMARINPNPDGIRIKCRRCRIRALRILLFASGRRILAIRRRPARAMAVASFAVCFFLCVQKDVAYFTKFGPIIQ